MAHSLQPLQIRPHDLVLKHCIGFVRPTARRPRLRTFLTGGGVNGDVDVWLFVGLFLFSRHRPCHVFATEVASRADRGKFPR